MQLRRTRQQVLIPSIRSYRLDVLRVTHTMGNPADVLIPSIRSYRLDTTGLVRCSRQNIGLNPFNQVISFGRDSVRSHRAGSKDVLIPSIRSYRLDLHSINNLTQASLVLIPSIRSYRLDMKYRWMNYWKKTTVLIPSIRSYRLDNLYVEAYDAAISDVLIPSIRSYRLDRYDCMTRKITCWS